MHPTRSSPGTPVISIVTLACIAVLALAWSGDGRYAALSLSTGYAAALLLGATLLVTPVYRIRRRRAAPVHLPVRRRLGVQAGVVAVAHMVLSFPVHFGGDISRFFFAEDGSILVNTFGASNWIGLLGIVILSALLVTSTDGWLRRLGIHNWLRLHRLVFAAAVAVVLHTVGYQSLRHALGTLTALLAVAVACLIAIRLRSRRYARPREPSAPPVPPATDA